MDSSQSHTDTFSGGALAYPALIFTGEVLAPGPLPWHLERQMLKDVCWWLEIHPELSCSGSLQLPDPGALRRYRMIKLYHGSSLAHLSR